MFTHLVRLTPNRALGKTTHPDTNLKKLREAVKQADAVRATQSLYILEGIARHMQRLWAELKELRSHRIVKPMFVRRQSIHKGMPLFWRRVSSLRSRFIDWEIRLPNRNLASEGFTQWLVVHHKLQHVYPGLKDLLSATKRLLEESKSPLLQEQFKIAADMHNNAIREYQEHYKNGVLQSEARIAKRKEDLQINHVDFVALCRKCWKTGHIRRQHLAEIEQRSRKRESRQPGGRDIPLDDPYVAASRGEVTIDQLDELLAEMHACERHRGWTVNSKSSSGELLLHNACVGGHSHIARRLVEHGASVNQVSDTITRLTPLMLAARNDHVAIMKMLLGNGARPDAVDHTGDTALHWSARYGRVAATRYLLGEEVMRTLHLSGTAVEDEGGPASNDPLESFLAFVNARNLRGRCASDLTDRKIVKLVFTTITNECNEKLASSRRARRKRSKSRSPTKNKRVYPAGRKGVFEYVVTKRARRRSSSNQEPSASNKGKPTRRRSVERSNNVYRTEKMVMGFLDRMDNTFGADGDSSEDSDANQDVLSLVTKP